MPNEFADVHWIDLGDGAANGSDESNVECSRTLQRYRLFSFGGHAIRPEANLFLYGSAPRSRRAFLARPGDQQRHFIRKLVRHRELRRDSIAASTLLIAGYSSYRDKNANIEVLQEAERKTSYRLKRHYLLQPSP
ncbi:hypothetical protein [Bradyrhizobium canariense]|uniref:hypothetical protein n=1 Tax=Bradyrhizobium canariense TaxID=255045 RepID=UPI0011774988|nr:hypothetical protein [Bradyrhizobium canariense]